MEGSSCGGVVGSFFGFMIVERRLKKFFSLFVLCNVLIISILSGGVARAEKVLEAVQHFPIFVCLYYKDANINP